MNAILVKGDAAGVTMYYGAGAGSEPTASAVLADVIEVTRLMRAEPEERVPYLAFQPDALSDVRDAADGRRRDVVLLARARQGSGRRAGRHRAHARRLRASRSTRCCKRAPATTTTRPTSSSSRTARASGNFDAAIAALVKLPAVRPHYARIRREDLV